MKLNYTMKTNSQLSSENGRPCVVGYPVESLVQFSLALFQLGFPNYGLETLAVADELSRLNHRPNGRGGEVREISDALHGVWETVDLFVFGCADEEITREAMGSDLPARKMKVKDWSRK